MATRPAPEIDIGHELIRSLLESQRPDLATEPIELLDRGWDNTNFRLGNEHIVRMPHRAMAAPLIRVEQTWLVEIATRVNVSVPVPVHHGRPEHGYPWGWSIVPWFDGEVAADSELSDPAATAIELGRFLAALGSPAPSDAPSNPHRGTPLTARVERFEDGIRQLGDSPDTDALRRVFEQGLAAAPAEERRWLHGDLHTRNIVVDDGRLNAVIDWSDLCAGDPATDLAAAFMLVPDHLGDVEAAHGSVDEPTWQRAAAWAVCFAIIYLLSSDDDPGMARVGQRLVNSLVEFDRS